MVHFQNVGEEVAKAGIIVNSTYSSHSLALVFCENRNEVGSCHLKENDMNFIERAHWKQILQEC